MSRQWLRRFGTERPGSAPDTSAFAPRPFAPKVPPVSQPAASAEEKPKETAASERPPLTTWSVEPPVQTWPLHAKAPAGEPTRQEPPEILPIEGFSPSEPLLQFTLKDARQWVKENSDRSGYPAGWRKIPGKRQIEKYIAERKTGWEELQTALEKESKEEAAPLPEAPLDSRKRKTPAPLEREKPAPLASSKKAKENAEEEEEPDEKHAEEEKKGSGDVATVRQIFLDVLRDLRVDDDLSKAIVVDLDLEGYDASALKFLRLSSHKEIASCFDTARRLFDLVGDPGSDASNSWDAAGPMRTALPLLVADIKAHRDSNCIYRCGIAGVAHGFTIILQGGRADLVQGFAGAGGESLAENLESGKTGYTIGKLIAHLNQLLHRNPGKTLQAQNELFSGSVDIEKIRRDDAAALATARSNKDLTEAHGDDQSDGTYLLFYRDLRKDAFQFERRGLYSQELIQARITAKVKANLRLLSRRR